MSALPQPDERWLDRYDIRRELGRGGFGRVYLAYDLRLDRDVAIKVLKQSDELAETELQRFRREINIAASLSHPNVVTVYDGGDHDGLSYLVMRYVEGRDLRHELRDGPLPHARLLSVVKQIASALDYAHGRGLVHRDVKPANILCEIGAERVYLADFGISRPVDQTTGEQLTQAGMGPATFYYAAPEQLKTGARIDTRTDVYAFGCVLYECLTASRPFEGKIGAVVGAHLHEPPPRVSDTRPDLSTQWDDVVARAMAKSPDRRYQHCGDVADTVARLETPSGGTFVDGRAMAETVTARAAGPAAPPRPADRTPTRTLRPTESSAPRAPARRREARITPGRWTALALIAALVALGGWQFRPQISDALSGATDETQVAGEAAADESGLDDGQRSLLETVGLFTAEECRSSTSQSFDGQATAVACASSAQTPTRVVYRRFEDQVARDAAVEQMASGRRAAADCRVADDATHAYRGANGDGQVVCNVAGGIAGITWTVPDQPIMGTARLDDTDSLGDLYTWWDGLVDRDPADRLPACDVDQGLQDRGAAVAVQCRMTAGVATVVSHAQFADAEAMDAWYDEVADNARDVRLQQVRTGDDHSACAGLGTAALRWVGADVPWSLEDSQGRLLCFVNESDQNALFWTDDGTGVGSVAVSPASEGPLDGLVGEWARSSYRLAE